MTARDLCRQAVIAEGRRTLTLTGRGHAALAQRLAPCDLFTPAQYDAIRNAGLDVRFVPLASVLEALT